MFHDAADKHPLAVANTVDVDLGSEIEEPIKQYRAVIGYVDCRVHVGTKVLIAVHDLHGTPAKHIRGPHDQRIADI